MKRHYFFRKSKYRAEHRNKGVIDFDLCALYGENAYYRNTGTEARHFTYFDQISVSTSLELGQYNFDIDTGTDSCQVHFAKSFNELLKHKTESGYVEVSERHYRMLRLLALQLLFKTVEKWVPLEGENQFGWNNDSSSRGWHFEIANTNFRYNRRGYSSETVANLVELNDHIVAERIRVSIFKNDYKSYRFQLSTYPFSPSYKSHDEAFKRFIGSLNHNDVDMITDQQYFRLRKLCKRLIFDYSDLDISDILKKQSHSIVIL